MSTDLALVLILLAAAVAGDANPLVWASVEPGPIGLPSQDAKRRSEGVETFSPPSIFTCG